MAKLDAAIAVTTLLVALILRPVKAFDQLLTPDNGGDVNVDGSLVHPTSWAIECDPWRERPIDVELDYLKINGTFLDDYDDWECPEEMRSISGCGDFLTDTRGIMCDEPKSFKRCSDQRVVNVPQPYVSQYHVCFQHPVGEYANYGTVDGLVTPPMIGRHRPRWAKWGEYEYLPPERWLHNAEHGAAIFLYHPCISEEDLCKLRQYIWNRPDDPLYGEDADDPNRAIAGKFRWILTPYPQLRTAMAIVAWGHGYYSQCLNEPGMDRFLDMYYRQAWEDWPPDGPYDYLYMGNTDDAADDAASTATTRSYVQDCPMMPKAEPPPAETPPPVPPAIEDMESASDTMSDAMSDNMSETMDDGSISKAIMAWPLTVGSMMLSALVTLVAGGGF